MSFFDNTVDHKSLKGTFLAWGIIVILLFVFLIALAALWSMNSPYTKQFQTVTSVLSVVYLFVSGIWWLGLHHRSTVTAS